MKSILLPAVHLVALVLLSVAAAGPLQAAADANEDGVRLLSAQLPAGKTIASADCETLGRALGRVTLTHRADAVAILSAALNGGYKKDAQHAPPKRPCACVVRLFRVSVAAAPSLSSALLDAASALRPECADELAAAASHPDDKNVVDGKDGPAAASTAPTTPTAPTAADRGNGDPLVDGDLSDRDYAGLGFGAGFPGSPGFVGSAPSGGFALPPVTPPPVTSVANQ